MISENFREIETDGGAVLFFIKKESEQNCIRKIITRNIKNKNDIFEKYINGDEKLANYIFIFKKTILGPCIIPGIHLSFYEKYMHKNINIKYAYIRNQIDSHKFKDAKKLIETLEDKNMKNYLNGLAEFKEQHYDSALKYFFICEQSNAVKNIIYIIYYNLGKKEKCITLLRELIFDNFEVIACKKNLAQLLDNSEAADIYYELREYTKALKIYEKENNIEKIILCLTAMYEKENNKTYAVKIAQRYTQLNDEKSAIEWLKLSI